MCEYVRKIKIQNNLNVLTIKEQDRQGTYKLTLQHVRVSTAAAEIQQCILCVLLNYTSLSTK